MNNKELSKKIINYSGEKENITFVTACMTRLRLSINDKEKVNFKELEKLDGVLGVTFQNNQLQVIIGSKVDKLLPVVKEELEFENNESLSSDENNDEKAFNSSNVGKNILEYISSAFQPILVAIIGAGVIKGLNMLFTTTFGWYTVESGLGKVMEILGDAPFFYLPFLLAYSAANKLKTSIPLALVVAGSYLYPTILNSTEASWNLFGLNIPLISYSGTVVPILLSVYFMSIIFKYSNKFIPDMLRSVLLPVVVLVVTVPVSLIALGPLGFYLSSWVATFLGWLFNFNGWIAGFVYGAIRPFLILTGMHLSISPVVIENIRSIGYDFLAPVHAISAMAVAGTTLGVFFKAKIKKNKTVALSAFIPAFLGITEPSMFGICLRFITPFIALSIGGGIGSAFVAGMGAKAYAFALPSPLSIAVYAETIPIMLIGWTIAFVISFIIAYVIGIDEEKVKN